MMYPKDALISFEVMEDLTFEYRFAHLHMALRSLKDSHQTQLAVDEHGTLEVTMRFPSHAAAKSPELFSHFFLFPLVEEEQEDDDDLDASTAHDR
jgi:hypothetical protein